MRWKVPDRLNILILPVSATVLTVLGVLFCYNLLADAAAVTVIQASSAAAVPGKTAGSGPGTAAIAAGLTAPISIGVPARIKIPRIRVNAAIEKVGVAADGSMGIPKKPLNVAWYNIGPRPGETGSAVISGHINWYYGAVGAFANLRKLKPGDKITTLDDKGTAVTFVIRELRKYDAAADATDIFVSADGKAHLNLITCAGVWDRRAKQYTQRLVVFADKE